MTISAGDRLLLQANAVASCKRFINGELVEVKAVQGGDILLTDGRVIPEHYRAFTHGYAVTSHAAQGKTVDEVLVVASSRSLAAINQQQFYVSISNHLMNTNTNPAAASEFSSRDNPCYGSDPSAATLNVFTDDERSYQLPYAQFLFSETTPNPALEKDADAPPEKLLIVFAVAKVTVLGSGLKSLERALQRYELKFVKSAGRRYAAALNTHVAAVTISFAKETL